MRFLQISLVALLSAVGVSAHAESAIRAGIGLSQVDMEFDDSAFAGEASAWEVFGGWELNQYFAAEAGYMDLGTIDDEVDDVLYIYDTTAFYASALASWPFTDAFSVYARAGMIMWEYNADAYEGNTTVASGKDDGNDPYFGGGVAAHLDGALLRLEYRVADVGDASLDLLGLSVVWRF